MEDHNYTRIAAAIRYLEEHMTRQPSLDEVAEAVHLSPFHLQKVFTEWAGISPKRFLQSLTVDSLKSKLMESRNLIEAADAVGLSAQSRVYDLFTTLEAVTPQEYKLNGLGVAIHYCVATTPFGSALIGTTNRGICWLSFIDENRSGNHVEEMKKFWFNSVFSRDDQKIQAVARMLFPKTNESKKPNLLVKGTNFQVKVWKALLDLSEGMLCTYQQIAQEIGSPRATQAVGSAVGSNHVAFLIPCHRVIRKDGILGEYRWGSVRKKTMIGWEMARAGSTV